MSEQAKHTRGPWILARKKCWPFGYEVVGTDGIGVISVDTLAHSTTQKTWDDCMNAVGFPYHDRPEVVANLERQAADMRLIASAPDLLSACMAASNALRSYQYGNSAPALAEEIADAVDAAIQKAKGNPT